MRSRKRRRKEKSGRLVGLLVLTGALAVICGWVINTLFVQGYLWRPVVVVPDPVAPGQVQNPPPLGDPTDKPEPTVTNAELRIQSYQVYTVQVAALSSETGATSLITKLNQQGYAATYRQEGNLFRIYAGLFSNREAAVAIAASIKGLDLDGFVKEISWSGGAWLVQGEHAAYITQVGEVTKTLDGVFQKFMGPQLDGSASASLKAQVEEAHEELSKAQPLGDLQALHSMLLSASSTMLGVVTSFDQFMSNNDQSLRLSAEKSLIEYAHLYQDVIKHFQNTLK